ncbi:MAG: glycine cleavage system protein GcvH [Proteobacteria bacterium]|nr:glycine cleavage system protein GcvH [Pseudomonadota bacterium]MDA1332202.1 glycine cleavage system protein GcvH [Pseudomonadota bacterium]
MLNDEKIKFSETHQWIQLNEEGVASVGISDYAQDSLGDVVYIELPSLGSVFKAGEQCGLIESVKTASDLFIPVAGEVVAVNEVLREQPELINELPQKTWIFKVKVIDVRPIEALMSQAQYLEFVATE